MAGNIVGAVGAALLGAGADFIGDIAAELKAKVGEMFTGPARAAVNKYTWNEPPAFYGIPRKAGNFLIDKAIDFFGLKADEQGASSMSAAGSVTSGPVVDQVRSAAAVRGWNTGPQWDALNWIIQKESSWNPSAQNPRSTASGLFQFIDSTWRAYRPPNGAPYAKARLAPPSIQAVAGMNYFGGRYGNPVNARAFWQRNGWYAQGGQVPEFHDGGRVPNVGVANVPAYLAPDERVLTAEQDNYFQRRLAADEQIDRTPTALVGQMSIQMEESNPRVVADEILHRLRVADRGGAYAISSYRG
jgi:SLT domain-containing protein